MAFCRRVSRATSETSSISAPARSMVAGAHHRPGMSGHSCDHVGHRRALDEHVVDARHLGVVVDAERGAGVALRVDVDDQHGQSGLGQRGGDVDGGGGLADATLLVGDGEDAGRRRLGEDPAGQGDPLAGVRGHGPGQRGVRGRRRQRRGQLRAVVRFT